MDRIVLRFSWNEKKSYQRKKKLPTKKQKLVAQSSRVNIKSCFNGIWHDTEEGHTQLRLSALESYFILHKTK